MFKMCTYKKYNQKIALNLEKCKRVCRCGHRVSLNGGARVLKNKKGYFLCSWCGGRIYYDPERQKEHDKQCDREEFRMTLKHYMIGNM